MNSYIKILILIVSSALSYTMAVAQVSLGSDIPPVEGAILQIKTTEPQEGYISDISKNTTATDGGLLLPFVQLTDINSLSDLFNPATQDEADRHIGLIVYHTGNTVIEEGIYYWDNNRWNLIHKGYINSSPWYKVGTNLSAKNHTDDMYLNAQVVINDTDNANNISPVNGSSLTIYGNDISVNNTRIGNGVSGNASNIVFGNKALITTNSTSNNTAIGHNTLSNNNLTGSDNNAIGYQALSSLTTGNRNMALGNMAGNTMTSESDNILLGYNVQPSEPNISEQINIANTVYGNKNTNRVGINTPNPQATLDVNGKVRATEQGAISGANILRINDNGIIQKSVIAPRKIAYIASSSNQSITASNMNTGSPQALLWEAGSVQINTGIIVNPNNTAVSEITIARDGVYEISGLVSYNPQAKAQTGSNPPSDPKAWMAGVIVETQYKKQGGEWQKLINVISSYSAGALLQNKEIHIPQMGIELQAGDQIRIVLYRPTSSYALAHGSSGTNPSISKLSDSKYTKILKIVSL